MNQPEAEDKETSPDVQLQVPGKHWFEYIGPGACVALVLIAGYAYLST